jgi:hypothetical protein
MAVSRREFLQRSGLLAAGALLPVSALAQANSLSQGKGTNGTGTTGTGGNGTIGTGLNAGSADAMWNQEAFLQCVGTEFALQQTPDQKVWLLLTAVTDMSAASVAKPVTMAVPPPKSATLPPNVDCFVLSFRASLAQPLTQSTYSLDHATLGSFPLFIVPSGTDPQLYFAVVNRLMPAAFKINPGRIGPPVGVTDLPPVTGGPSGNGGPAGKGGNTGGGAGTPKPSPNAGPGPEQGPGIQPNFNRE